MLSYEVPDPPSSGKASVETDAPQLLPLFERCPNIRICTRSNPHFKAVSKLLAAHTDDLPLAVVRVKSEEEIFATIDLCERTGLPLGVRSGGNDFGDRNYVEGAVVIDVRLLNSITIAPDRKSATIGGGIVQGQLLQLLDKEGLDTPVGWGHQVGYAGWACAGGYGVEVGARGLGVDQILGGRIVVPGGHVVVASLTDDEDAYWSLRGGGAGMFGVVSELTIKLYPRPKVYAGHVAFPMSELPDVFANFERLFAESFPDNFAGEVFLLNPPGTGGIVNHFFWWQLKDDGSDLAEAEAYLDRVKQLGTVIQQNVKQTTPYEFLFTIENPLMEDRQYFANSSCTVTGFTAQLGQVLSAHPMPTPTSCIVLHNCHGFGAHADAYGAFGNRTTHLLVGISASSAYADMEARHAIDPWPQKLLKDLEKSGLPLLGKYANFNPREPGDGRMYFGEHGLGRMRAIKRKFDPKNTFAICTPDLVG